MRVPAALIMGPADSHLTDFAREAQSMGIPCISGLTLSQLLALLQEGSAYVGNDSGVSHLAAVAGIETLVIFGPSDPLVWAPPGANTHVIRACWHDDENQVWPDPQEAPPELEDIKRILVPLIAAQDEKDNV
jgi:ADP-heptose:LPS heptosyltransferase